MPMIATALLPILLLASGASSPADTGSCQDPHLAQSPPGGAYQERHGRVDWFEGTYEELLAKAAHEQRVVMLNFYTDLCTYCRVLDREALSDARVVDELQPVLCFSIDAESELGKPLSELYPTENHFPALIFLDPDGSLRDRIIGYMPTRSFRPELERILGDENTLSSLRRAAEANPKDVNAIWHLACKLEAMGDREACNREIQRIKQLDPEGRSLPMRHMALERTIARSIESGDDEILRRFLANETYPEVLFEGWSQLAYGDLMRSKRASMQGLPKQAWKHKVAYHRCHLKAWDNCPAELRAEFGNHVAWELYLDWPKLDEEQREAALSVAREAVSAAPDNPDFIDTLACLLFSNGQVEEAVLLMQKCIRLEPDYVLWEQRLVMFQTEES